VRCFFWFCRLQLLVALCPVISRPFFVIIPVCFYLLHLILMLWSFFSVFGRPRAFPLDYSMELASAAFFPFLERGCCSYCFFCRFLSGLRSAGPLSGRGPSSLLNFDIAPSHPLSSPLYLSFHSIRRCLLNFFRLGFFFPPSFSAQSFTPPTFLVGVLIFLPRKILFFSFPRAPFSTPIPCPILLS